MLAAQLSHDIIRIITDGDLPFFESYLTKSRRNLKKSGRESCHCQTATKE